MSSSARAQLVFKVEDLCQQLLEEPPASPVRLAPTSCGADQKVKGEQQEQHPAQQLARAIRRMQDREKVAAMALAALLVAVAVLELAMALPLLLHTSARHRQAARQKGANDTVYPRFLVLGDWGRDGAFNQSLVAAAMAAKAESLGPHFIVSTGDNFYEAGLVSVEDPQFDTSFRHIYNHSSLQVPWHAVLGNHDWGEVVGDTPKKPLPERCGSDPAACYYSPLHQLDSALTLRDWRWHCERSYHLQLAGGLVEIFFIDTTPIIDDYQKKDWADRRGGLLEQSWEDQVQELESRLARSQAQWRIVVGHHPIRTNHIKKLGWKDLEERVEPLLIKYGVQAYFCGHDHNLQYIYSPQRRYHHIVSGAGSETYGEFLGDTDSPFQYGANGFVAVSLGEESMTVEFLGLGSRDPLYVVEIPRNLSSGPGAR